MKLTEYLDVKKLRQHINVGLVTERFHDTLPLVIYCYGRKAVFDQHWDDVTTRTRGLIVDINTNDIVARPYEKFFSYDTVGRSETYPRSVENVEAEFGPPVITEKVNGCLGTFWRYGIDWGVASKGSFHSPHAKFATEWLEKHVEEHGALVFPEGYTPVFEIICQEVQPHVIKYPEDGLVLLSFVNIETGEEIGDEGGDITYELYEYAEKNHIKACDLIPMTLKEALETDSDTVEGFVATYNRPGQAPLKLKIKFPTFLKNRKLFYAAQKQAEPKNNDAYVAIFTEATTLLRDALVSCTERKEFAEFFQKGNSTLAPVCFAMMDEHDYKKVIWRIVDRQQREGSTQTSTA